MKGDVQELAIQLTQEMYKKGGTSWFELSNGTHEIFVRVKLKGKTPIQSTGIIEVDTTVMKMETIPGNRAVTTGKPDRKEDKKEKCVCEARVRAFMRMLRVKEGTEGESGYKKRYGGTFTDMRTHPQIKTTSGGYTSSAAGAYQIMGYTYDWLNGKEFDKKNKPTGGYNKNHDYIKKYNIPDFTQESQDKLCVIILKHKRSSNFLDLIIQNRIQEALEKYGSYEWASLPPSRYGQPNQTMENALSNYNKFLKLELLEKSDLHLKKDFLKDFGYTCGSCSIKSDTSSTCKLCHKKHIDLSNKVVWQTQFNPKWGDKKAQNSACKKTCDAILISFGLKATSKDKLYQTALENKTHTKLEIKTAQAKLGVAYLDSQLEKGNPVQVGVDHDLNYRGGINEGTIDHFIVIVGRSCENGRIYYLFYDVGTSYKAKGASPNNKLYLDVSDYSLKRENGI